MTPIRWLIAGFTLVFSLLLYSVTDIILPFIVSFFAAYAMSGIVKKMMNKGLSRNTSSTVVIIVFVLGMVLLAVIAIPYIQNQLLLLIKSAPELVQRLRKSVFPLVDYAAVEWGIDSASEIKEQVAHHVGDVVSFSANIMRHIIGSGMAIANIISLLFLTPIIIFYLLKDWPHLLGYGESLIPLNMRDSFKSLMLDIHHTLGGYVKSQAKVCGLLMVMYGLALWSIGLKQGLFIGVITGALSFIPYIGATIGFLATMALALSQDTSWSFLILVAVVFLSISLIEGYFIVPKVIGKYVGLHPVWMIFALFAGANWFGFIGILLAIPVGSIIGVIIRRSYKHYRQSLWYNTPNSSSST
jgi:predicted PurR-regulated permease PerM